MEKKDVHKTMCRNSTERNRYKIMEDKAKKVV